MLTIRQARPSDCDAMCAVHRDAIARHYAESHGPAAAETWADSVQPSLCAHWLASEMVIVAEEAGALLAFAQFDGNTGAIEVSASQEAERRAIPAALLAVIETEARARGMETLRLLAMPGAEPAYATSGFSDGEARLVAVNSGPPHRALKKTLTYPLPRLERRRSPRGPVNHVSG